MPEVAGRDPRALVRETLQAMFGRSDDPYIGADLTSSRRVVAAMIGFSSLLSLVFFPLDPPTDPIGGAGWVVAGAVVVVGLVGVRRLLQREVGFDALMVAAYLAPIQIATLVWLAGGVSSDYEDLYVFALSAGLVHPPRRALGQLGFVVLCLSAPLVYRGFDSVAEAKVAAEAVLLVAIAGVVMTFLFNVRRQRFQLQRGEEVARRLARVDSLTGLANRRAFDESLTVEIARAERDGQPMTVALVDLDGLKRINDRFGHLAGDRVLADVARALERSVRTGDRCFRWGGDEFAVLLPNTDRAAGAYVLGRAADRVGRDCRDEDGEPLDISYGVAELEHGGSPEDLLALADLALMEHKTEKRRG
jgi:diguanylate cyclase (GGDEF)-like protein